MVFEDQKRKVMTRCGIVSAFGCGPGKVWHRHLKGRSGLTSLSSEISERTGITVAGQVTSLTKDPVAGHDPERFIPTDLVDLTSRASAITLALSDGFGSGNVNASILFRRWEATP